MKSFHLKDKIFYKSLYSIALPIAIQNLISSALNMIDTMMIGQLGDASIAAVGQANQVFFLFILLSFGINSSCAIFSSQFWGKKDISNIRRVLGLSLFSGGAISILFSLSGILFPQMLMKLFTTDLEVISIGSDYLRIVSVSFLFTTISLSYSFSCRSIGQAKLPMIVSIIALATNTILNYIFIFGSFGFPMLGVKGAAIATVIARAVEMILITTIIYNRKGALSASIGEMLDLSKNFVSKILKTGIPVVLNEGFWALGVIMYTIAFGRISTEAIASVHIANNIQQIFMVVTFSLANASAVMLGNEIGAGNKENAYSYAITFILLGILVGILLGAGLIYSSPFILSLYKISSEVYYNSKIILFIMGLLIWVRIITTMLIIGILRSGGDTTYSLFIEIGCVWGIGVPLAFIGAMVWRLPIYWVYSLVALEELAKAIIGIPRVLSKKWIKNLVENM